MNNQPNQDTTFFKKWMNNNRNNADINRSYSHKMSENPNPLRIDTPNVNKSLSNRTTSRQTKFNVEDDQELNTTPTRQLYEMENSRSFRNQVDEMKIHPLQKETFINTQEMMTEKVENLKVQNETLKADRRELACDLAEATTEVDQIKVMVDQKEKEVRNIQSEVERLQVSDESAQQITKKCRAELQQVRTELFDKKTLSNKLSEENNKLRIENKSIKVDNLTYKSQIEDLLANQNLLENSLKLNNTSLAAKLQVYDNKFREIKEEGDEMREQGKKVKEQQEEMGREQNSQMRELFNSLGMMDSMDKRVHAMEGRVLSMDQGIQSMTKSMHELHQILTVDLVNEVKQSQEKRDQIDQESNRLSNSHEKMQSRVFSNMKKMANDISLIKDNEFEIIKRYQFYIAAGMIICALLGSQFLK